MISLNEISYFILFFMVLSHYKNKGASNQDVAGHLFFIKRSVNLVRELYSSISA